MKVAWGAPAFGAVRDIQARIAERARTTSGGRTPGLRKNAGEEVSQNYQTVKLSNGLQRR